MRRAIPLEPCHELLRLLAAALALLALACPGEPPQRHSRPTSPIEPAAPTLSPLIKIDVEAVLAAQDDKPEEPPQACRTLGPRLLVCPNESTLAGWALETHQKEADEASLAAALEPSDAIAIRDGLNVYQDLLRGVARRTRAHLDLWDNTPTLSPAEVVYFTEHPRLWETVVAIHAVRSGRQGEDLLEAAVQRHRNDREALRHLVLRNGYVYFENVWTADWAARHLRLGDLFDTPQIELHQAGRLYVLDRFAGDYIYTGDFAGPYRVRLSALDRVGEVGSLEPTPGYDLAGLRAAVGLDHLELGDEALAGRSAHAVFLTGESYTGRIVRVGRQGSRLGLIGELEALERTLRESLHQNEAIRGLLANAFAMVREETFFDEPPNEMGQQDGIMRPAFERAFLRGERFYIVNGVSIPIYDASGRPHPPQVCVDFVTDAVDRFTGTWFALDEVGAPVRTRGRIDIRDYIPVRQVERLVEMAMSGGNMAAIYSFPEPDQVQFGMGSAFYDNLWRHRDAFRMADVVVIYGRKADGRNHYHSFYVYETDPIFGMPTIVIDQAGQARIRSWHSVMVNGPRRSVRHRIRWNPEFLLPHAGPAAE